MRRAGTIAALGRDRSHEGHAPRRLRIPLGAAAEYVYLMHGTRGAEATARSSPEVQYLMMHYWRNNCVLREGDMVIFDYAPDVNNYTSDIAACGRSTASTRRCSASCMVRHRVSQAA